MRYLGIGGVAGLAGCGGDGNDTATPTDEVGNGTGDGTETPTGTPRPSYEGNVLTVNEAGDAVADGTYGMQYQFTLHEGIEFHNGEELTAQNVVDTYNRYENSQVSAYIWNNFLFAEAGDDDYTVNLYAQRPSAEALRNVTTFVLPSDHIGLDDGALDPREGTDPVGTGAYEFSSFTDEETFAVEKSDSYWLEDVGIQNKDWFDGPGDFPNAPEIDTVEHQVVPEESARGSAIESGEIDITTRLTAQQQTNFDESNGFTVTSIETGGYLFLQYPVQVEPWGNRSVRQAANHLMPRETIVDDIERGWSREAWTPLPELAEGAGTTDSEQLENDLRPKNELDRQQAKSLIDDAGVDTPIQLQIDTNSENSNRVDTAELIAQSMEQPVDGEQLFEVSVETFEFTTLLGRVYAPEYPQQTNDDGAPTALLIGLSGTFDPGSFCEVTHQTSAIGQCCNANGYSNEELDTKMDNAKFGQDVLDDVQERASRYDEIWRDVVDISANSYIDIDLTVAVHTNDLVDMNAYPFPEGLYSYALYGPADNQLATLDRDDNTLKVGVVSNLSSFDPPYSSGTPATLAQNYIYEGLMTTGADGTLYPWLAESFELVGTQDVSAEDYVEYMTTVTFEPVEGGTWAPDTDAQIVIEDPENGPPS
jgi:ABC-type transport system substrate-binding protein